MLSVYVDLDESGFVEEEGEEDDAIPCNQQQAKEEEVLKKARCLD